MQSFIQCLAFTVWLCGVGAAHAGYGGIKEPPSGTNGWTPAQTLNRGLQAEGAQRAGMPDAAQPVKALPRVTLPSTAARNQPGDKAAH